MKKRQLAYQVVDLCKMQLFLQHRFLEAALYRLPLIEDEIIDIMGTDGRNYYYQTDGCLKQYLEDPKLPEDIFLHMVLHCIFQHPFQTGKDADYWNLAADIAAAAVMKEFDCSLSRQVERLISNLEQLLTYISAQMIYRYLLRTDARRQGVCGLSFESAAALFKKDDHRFWAAKNNEQRGQESGEGTDENAGKSGDGVWETAAEEAGTDTDCGEMSAGEIEELRREWKDVAERMDMELQDFGDKRGVEAGHLLQNLREVERDRIDYEEFLRKFAVLRETMELDLDEFDYIFYTYGLNLYGNVPLIEPLEYKEKYQIHDFVIAIDTSGSCSGETVQSFLQKTYSILKESESYDKKVNIHLIQCDCAIQKVDVIESLDELTAYMSGLELHGFGGTDFHPVFSYIDEQLKKHGFSRLEGMIYFTDGYGEFPSRPPRYKTAFAFVNQKDIPPVPPWAMRVIWDEEDFKEDEY